LGRFASISINSFIHSSFSKRNEWELMKWSGGKQSTHSSIQK
jgi:hypothetical protein